MKLHILVATLILATSAAYAAPIDTSICDGKMSVARKNAYVGTESIELFACTQTSGLDAELNQRFCLAYTLEEKLQGHSTLHDFIGRFKRSVYLFNVTPVYERHAFYAGEIDQVTEIEFGGWGYRYPGESSVAFQGGVYDYVEPNNPSRDGYIGRRRAVIAKMNFNNGEIVADQNVIFENDKQVSGPFQKTLQTRSFRCSSVEKSR